MHSLDSFSFSICFYKQNFIAPKVETETMKENNIAKIMITTPERLPSIANRRRLQAHRNTREVGTRGEIFLRNCEFGESMLLGNGGCIHVV